MNANETATGGAPVKTAVPEPLTVPEVQQILNAAWKTKFAAYIILRIWAGLRPMEAHGLDLTKNLKLSLGVVLVNDGPFRRAVKLSPALIKMLMTLQAEGRLPEVIVKPSDRAVGKLLKEAGAGGNQLRQTAIAYYLAEHGDVFQTSQWGGVSTGYLRHAFSPITTEQARAFWNLVPNALA